MTISRSEMCARLSSLGWRQKDVHHMIDTIDKWKSCSGEEWTVNRLKAMKQSLLNRMAGIPDENPWISKHPDGSFKGAFRPLSRLATYRDKVRALNTVMAYSTMISSEPTPSQWRKFSQSAEHSPMEQPTRPGVEVAWLRLLPKFQPRRPKPAVLDDLVLSSERRAPFWKEGRTRTVVETEIKEWLPSSFDTHFVRRMSSRLPEVFEGLDLDGYPYMARLPSTLRYPIGDARACADSVGKVSFIQEPGFKLRAVANPNRVIQCALLPLQREVFDMLKNIDEDCTFDQDKGVKWVSQQLSLGRTCHSIDLSDATNNFPLRLQMLTLRRLMPKEWGPWLTLFEESSKGPWRVWDPELQEEREFSWNKGQPLGLGPSFASFALSHHLLARAAISRSQDRDADYRILGDDIVMVGDNAKEEYLNLLQHYGCPVSSSKTISSDRLAEFAGKIVLRDEEPITPFKWRETSDRSFIDAARNVGPRAIGFLRPRQRKVVNLIAEIPEDFGGLGWNPDGLPYEERITRNLATIRALQTDVAASPYGIANQHVRRWRTEEHLRNGFKGNPLVQPPATAAAERPAPPAHLSGKLAILSVLRPRFEAVDPLLDPVPSWYRPVAREGDPRGVSTLNSYESKLKHVAKSKRTSPER